MNRYTVSVTVEVEAESVHHAYALIRQSIVKLHITDQEVVVVAIDAPCDDCGLLSCACQ